MAEGRFSNPFSAVFTGVYDLFKSKARIRELREDESLRGKTCLVTGANSGLGFGISTLLARRGARLIMACRSGIPTAGEKVKSKTGSSEILMYPIDLCSFDSIDQFVMQMERDQIQLDVAIFNAGVTPPKARKTPAGLDEMFMVNYLAKFYLVNQLINKGIIKPAGKSISRIIFISSDSHQNASAIEIDQLGVFEDYQGASRGVSLYSYNKLILNTFAVELSRRLNPTDSVLYSVLVICPGPVNSNIIRDAPSLLKMFLKAVFWLFFKSPQKAAEPVLYFAIAEELEGKSGLYLHMKNPKKMDEKVYDPEVGKQLWQKSIELISEYN